MFSFNEFAAEPKPAAEPFFLYVLCCLCVCFKYVSVYMCAEYYCMLLDCSTVCSMCLKSPPRSRFSVVCMLSLADYNVRCVCYWFKEPAAELLLVCIVYIMCCSLFKHVSVYLTFVYVYVCVLMFINFS